MVQRWVSEIRRHQQTNTFIFMSKIYSIIRKYMYLENTKKNGLLDYHTRGELVVGSIVKGGFVGAATLLI